MLLADRDSHGNLQVSLIPTERLLIDMVSSRVKEIDSSVAFKTHTHFFGYEGRCGAPTLFDAAYTYNLGLVAGSLILDDRTGYMAAFTAFDKGGKPLAVPLTGLINVETRHGVDEHVIEKALVKLDSPAYEYFKSRRDDWAGSDQFSSPGPRQFWGPTANQVPMTVAINQGYGSLDFNF
jgi:pyrophosphate--fructose-6-phosphate 1-phosphotransferase